MFVMCYNDSVHSAICFETGRRVAMHRATGRRVAMHRATHSVSLLYSMVRCGRSLQRIAGDRSVQVRSSDRERCH